MEKRIYIKNKSSLGGDDGQGKFYKIRARLGKKQNKHLLIDVREKLTKTPRAYSSSPRKGHCTLADIFKQARKVRSCETYLLSSTQNNLKNQEELASPGSKYSKHPKKFNSNSHLPHTRSHSTHKQRASVAASGNKNIQQKFEIRIEGNQLKYKNQQELMTTLSRIILGQDSNPDLYTFEILEESSIIGNQQNFIDIDEIFLPDNMRHSEQKVLNIWP